jgi:hypothetical protein
MLIFSFFFSSLLIACGGVRGQWEQESSFALHLQKNENSLLRLGFSVNIFSPRLRWIARLVVAFL